MPITSFVWRRRYMSYVLECLFHRYLSNANLDWTGRTAQCSRITSIQSCLVLFAAFTARVRAVWATPRCGGVNGSLLQLWLHVLVEYRSVPRLRNWLRNSRGRQIRHDAKSDPSSRSHEAERCRAAIIGIERPVVGSTLVTSTLFLKR